MKLPRLAGRERESAADSGSTTGAEKRHGGNEQTDALTRTGPRRAPNWNNCGRNWRRPSRPATRTSTSPSGRRPSSRTTRSAANARTPPPFATPEAPLAFDLLAILDNLDRAVAAAKQAGETGPLVQGVAMVQTQVLDVFRRHGITRIEAQGQPFDPNQHQAVMQQPTKDYPPGTVAAGAGTRLHDPRPRPAAGPRRRLDGRRTA